MKNIVFPITQMRHPRNENIYAHLRMLRKTQWWKTPQPNHPIITLCKNDNESGGV